MEAYNRENFYDTEEVLDQLSISRKTLYTMRMRGAVKCFTHKFTKKILFLKSDIQELKENVLEPRGWNEGEAHGS